MVGSSGRYYTDQLNYFTLEQARSLFQLWVKKTTASNGNLLIKAFQNLLREPAQIKAVLSRLSRRERNALVLMKRLGEVVPARTLNAFLFAIGETVSPPLDQRNYSVIQELIDHGIVMPTESYHHQLIFRPGRYESASEQSLFTDSRILACVDWSLAVPETSLPVVEPPLTVQSRRPQNVMLDILGLLQAIESLGGIGMTQKDEMRVNDLKKLNRAMGWTGDGVLFDNLFFPEPFYFFIPVLIRAGVLKNKVTRINSNVPPLEFAKRPYPEQMGSIFPALVEISGWSEDSRLVSPDLFRFEGRRLVLMFLETLSLPDDFVSFQALDDLLFERIGKIFVLDPRSNRTLRDRLDLLPDTPLETLAKWEEEVRKEWKANESAWLRRVFTTWLYALGLVELGLENNEVTCFRLTPLGRTLIQGKPFTMDPVITATAPAWIVQPNFDILVYLEHVSGLQLGFLEQYAERVSSQQHTAHYKLTRDSVYQGLEKGGDANALLEQLTLGAAAPLPQNVQVEIREWAGRREKLILHRRARIVEFSNQAQRDADLKFQPHGQPVGERFIWLDSQAGPQTGKVIDYLKPLERCLQVTEDGRLSQSKPVSDWALPAALNLWAEPQPGGAWLLSASRIRAVVKQGARIGVLLDLLYKRLTHTVPPLLELVLGNWAGYKRDFHMASVILIQCENDDLFKIMTTSPMFQPFLLGTLGERLIMVDPKRLPQFQERLAWAGFAPDDVIFFKPFTPRP